MIRLYKDDLIEINAAISELTDEIKWGTEKYEYDSLEEFLESNNEKEFKFLKIEARKPSINVNVYSHRCELSVFSDEVAHEGIYNRLDRILAKRELKALSFIGSNTFWIIMMFLTLTPLVVSIPKVPGFIIFGSLLFAYAIASYLRLTRNSIIRIRKRDEEKSFWKRNKDQILLILLGAILGSVLTILVDYFKK